MDEQHNKTLERLTRAVELAYNSPGRIFWRGFMGGLGRGLGMVVGWLILITILYYLFKASGLDHTFRETFETLRQVGGTLQNLR